MGVDKRDRNTIHYNEKLNPQLNLKITSFTTTHWFCIILSAGVLPTPVSPVPAELTLWTATWLQAPGAAPQSTTLYPGCKRRNLSSISSSLKALLHRKFWAWDALTYGSLSCRSSQRCSAGLLLFNFFIKHSEECRDLLCGDKRHIVLTVRGHVMCAKGELRLRGNTTRHWSSQCVIPIDVPLLQRW